MLNSTEDDDENFQYDDLKQENQILRGELTALYAQFLSPKYDSMLVNNAEKSSQTEFDIVAALEETRFQLRSCQTDLVHEKSHNADQAKLSKEADRKIRELERKILDINLELLQTAPLKDKLEETLRSNETLQNKLSGAANEQLNLTVEVKHCKDKISTLNNQIEEQQHQLDDHVRQLHVAETAASALKKVIEQKDSQIAAAANLNGEYQAKLQKDDIQFLKLNGELNHWERKCESQSKEIQRLNEAHKALTARFDATVQAMRDLETRTRTTSESTSHAANSAEGPLQFGCFNGGSNTPEAQIHPHKHALTRAHSAPTSQLSQHQLQLQHAHLAKESNPRSASFSNGTKSAKDSRSGGVKYNDPDLCTPESPGHLDTETCVCNFPFFGTMSPRKPKKDKGTTKLNNVDFSL